MDTNTRAQLPVCLHCGMPIADPYSHADRYAHDPEYRDERGPYRFDTRTGRPVALEG